MVRSFRLSILVLLAASACGAPPVPSVKPDTAITELTADLAPFVWMLGAWEGEGGATRETWVAAKSALVAASFTIAPASAAPATVAFEVMFIHRDPRGHLVLTALPGGQASVDFALSEQGETSATFANPGHDFPQTIQYRRDGDALTATLRAADAESVTFRWRAATVAAAPALADADRRFAAETATDRLEAWVRWFDPAGATWRPAGRIEGRAAIRAAMTPVFANPAFHLDWAPIASGLSPASDLGFTVGRASRPTGTGYYVTIWRRQPDGTWLVLFDTGGDD